MFVATSLAAIRAWSSPRSPPPVGVSVARTRPSRASVGESRPVQAFLSASDHGSKVRPFASDPFVYTGNVASAASPAMLHSSSPPSSDFAVISRTYRFANISTRSHSPSSSSSFSITSNGNRSRKACCPPGSVGPYHLKPGTRSAVTP
jgi:hypothetical protein